MRVLKYLRGHIPAVALIVLLLVAQSFCELSLPAYTSSIVDTGIQSGGIEYAAPLALTDKTMDGVRLFLSDDDAGHVCPPVGAGGEHRARPAAADAGRPHHA